MLNKTTKLSLIAAVVAVIAAVVIITMMRSNSSTSETVAKTDSLAESSTVSEAVAQPQTNESDETQAASEMDTLNVGIISTESSAALREQWAPLLEDMEEELGVEVEPFFATDYAGIIQAMRFNKVDVAWFGNKSAMEAVDRSGGEIFAQTVPANGEPGYWSLLITHKDSPLNNVDDVLANAKDLTFGNGDPNSTSGFLVPSYYVFTKNNVDPKTAFKRVLNSNHETNALAVANKKVDFATNNTETMANIEERFPDKYKNIKVLWKSPLIPSDPMVWRKNLPADMKEEIKDFFLTYGQSGDSEEKANIALLDLSKFQPSNDDQLLPIRQLELFKTRGKLIQDGATEDSAEVKEIDAKLVSLNSRMASLS